MSLPRILLLSAFAVASGSAFSQAQAGDLKDVLLKRLSDQFVLTKMAADGNDVVKAGSIVTLRKDGLQMCSVQAVIPLPNTYKEGKLSAGKFAWGIAMGLAQPSLPTANVPTRTFVADEKFWITALGVQKNEVVLKVYSDVYQDVRYYAQIGFPFNKKSVPTAEELMKEIAEVVTAEPAASPDQATAPQPAGGASQASTQTLPPVAAPVLAPIAPPPPPADAAPPSPPTVSTGQTNDQVIAILGQPKNVAKAAGGKTIFTYPDLKIIFVNGKVSDVQ
jgi:hypothetical protein